MTTVITSIDALPFSPFQGSEFIGIVITSGVPSYFRITGVELDRITDITWFPLNPSSLDFITRQLILTDDTATEGTFLVKVNDNYLNITDRGGKLSIRLDTGETLSYPVKTYGFVSYQPLWQSPYDGLITG